MSGQSNQACLKSEINIRNILKNYTFSNAKILFDILSNKSLIISYSIDHTKDSIVFVYDLEEGNIIKEKVFKTKSIENLKVINSKILLHLSFEEDDCLIIMDGNLEIDKTKEEFGFSDLIGANDSFIYTFNFYLSSLIIFDWSFNNVETNLNFQSMDSTEPFYIECETINKFNFIDMINNTYILNLKVDYNEYKVFLFDQDGIAINSFKSAEIINTSQYEAIIAVFENKSIKLFDLKGEQIEVLKSLNFDHNQIDKFIINNDKIYFLDKNYQIHTKVMRDINQRL
jgi:hypothetical protein